MAAERIKRILRAGLHELDEEARRLAESYGSGSLALDEYLERRVEVEREKVRRVLRNLREMRAGM